MQKHIDEFEGIEVDAESYALLAPVIEHTRNLLHQAQKEGGLRVGRPKSGTFGLGVNLKSLNFPTPMESGTDVVSVSVETLNRTLNTLLVQAGSKCHHGRPESAIEHHVGPLGNFYQCGHDPPHYWDENGVKLDERP